MADRRSYLLRIDRKVLDAMQRWARDDLRSVNAQIEFVLRRALHGEGRLPQEDPTAGSAKPPLDPGRRRDPP